MKIALSLHSNGTFRYVSNGKMITLEHGWI